MNLLPKSAGLRGWRPGLTAWILFGLAVGAAVGLLWPDLGLSLEPLATIFIRLMLMILAPLIFSALVVALAGSGPLPSDLRIGSSS
jgi:Na+/H+-dicarboxylate symporter